MKNRLKRLLAAMFAAVFMLADMTSCGFIIINNMDADASDESSAETDRTVPDSSTDTKKEYTKYEGDDSFAQSRRYLAELPERDWNGAVFFITTTNRDYISPDDTDSGTVVNKLVVERNADIEEQFGITMITSVADVNTMYSELRQAVASDSYYTDLLMIPVYMIGTFRAGDTLINMRSLPFFNVDQPYFNKASSDMTSGGYSTYGIAGQACISPSSFTAMYMNKTILTEAGVDTDSVYDSAASGKWTWDDALSYAEAVRSLDSGYNTFAAEESAGRFADLVFISSGNEYVKTGRRVIPIIGYSLKSTEKTMDTLMKLYNDQSSLLKKEDGGIVSFSEGKVAFLTDYLYVMPWMTNSSADWGVLPLPKEDEKDEYRTLISNTESVFAVPKNHTNGEFPAIIVSALNAASYGYIYDKYVEYCMLHVLRDNSSVNMLDMLLDTASFDFALAFGNAYPKIAAATYQLIRDCAPYNNLGDYFAERRSAALAVMKEYFPLKS